MQSMIDGKILHEILTAGYKNLKKNMAVVNDLNVFPVPDGDTGTNMVHTLGGGLSGVAPTAHVGDYMKALSGASLLSARGNSGVIFSQFIKGLARGLENKETLSVSDLPHAFTCAKEDAYHSIHTPTEGTILTVIREGEAFLLENGNQWEDFSTLLEALLANMRQTLARTPDLLPVLKEAGVVDSGGAGLICFFEGILAYFNGVDLEDVEDFDLPTPSAPINANFNANSTMEYGYCTEFILQLLHAKTNVAAFSRDEFMKPLEEMGDSLVTVVNEDIVKVHIHTFAPEQVLAYARTFGEFVTLKIENMSVQHSETQTQPPKEKVKYAIIAVASGEGIVDYFYNIGVTAVVNGGQTNNPSVDDFLTVFNRFDAEHIVVLPNNSNIILTANQAAALYTQTPVHVLPTTSVVEGYSALSMMNLWCDTVEELLADMTMGFDSVISGYVTTATRDTSLSGVAIQKGHYIGLKNKEIVADSVSRQEVAQAVVHSAMEEGQRIAVIVFYGANVPKEEAEALVSNLQSQYPTTEFGLIEGKQEVYDYIISME